MQNLNRTFTGRTTHYSPDGYGRDWYIMHNNGGISKNPCTTGFSTDKSPKQRTFSPPQPKMEAKFTRYTSDGSGRDAYIQCNFGGLVSAYGSKPFYTTLRTWSPIKTPNTNDIYFKSQQMWLRRRARKNSFQEDLNSRLSAPKRIEQHSSSPSKRSWDSPSKNSMNSSRVPYPKAG